MLNIGAKSFQSITFGADANGCTTETFVCASNGGASIPEIVVSDFSETPLPTSFPFSSTAPAMEWSLDLQENR